jgi:hypothetical protein
MTWISVLQLTKSTRQRFIGHHILQSLTMTMIMTTYSNVIRLKYLTVFWLCHVVHSLEVSSTSTWWLVVSVLLGDTSRLTPLIWKYKCYHFVKDKAYSPSFDFTVLNTLALTNQEMGSASVGVNLGPESEWIWCPKSPLLGAFQMAFSRT